ncbi:MAG: hypothetical protein LBU15_00825 [Rickettsiales bacterium]|jgi:phosphate-selective porin|nr:hypothetical protein [Rickettsiales bacterium]
MGLAPLGSSPAVGKEDSQNRLKFSGRVHGEFSSNGNGGRAGELFGIRETSNRYSNVHLSNVLFITDFKVIDENHLVAKLALGGGDVALDSLFFRRDLARGLSLMVGQITLPFSMEADTNGNHSVMNGKTRMNLGDSNSRNVSRKNVQFFTTSGIGLNLRYSGWHSNWQIGVYGNDLRDNSKQISKTIFSGRLNLNPWRDGDNLIHLGVSYFYEDRRFPSLSTPMTGTDASSIGSLPIFGADRIGLEAALNYGLFNIQLEYGLPRIRFGKFDDTSSRAKTRRLGALAVQLNINLTGETMKYDEGSFKFEGVRNPLGRGRYGTFGLALRYANGNFNDYSTTRPFDYGRHEEWALALNWRPVNSLRFTAQHSWFRERFDLPEAVRLNGGEGDSRYNLFSLKSRFFF